MNLYFEHTLRTLCRRITHLSNTANCIAHVFGEWNAPPLESLDFGPVNRKARPIIERHVGVIDTLMYGVETDAQLFIRSKVSIMPFSIRISRRQELATEPIRVLGTIFE